ncbi:CLUMA_CG020064, isoform A [Clunio marinus]|uniref:CLUMA_CG020064, isoform A n=1 Tax=Clunio marinus TaxID=568069 RepID=A0A1J1J666_9DIPT|nr:CLUMA_CG020064, isoform A [Clunio marinus]
MINKKLLKEQEKFSIHLRVELLGLKNNANSSEKDHSERCKMKSIQNFLVHFHLHFWLMLGSEFEWVVDWLLGCCLSGKTLVQLEVLSDDKDRKIARRKTNIFINNKRWGKHLIYSDGGERRHQTKHRDKDGNYAINKLLLPPLEDVSLSLTIKSGASMMNLFFFATLVHSCLLTMDCGVTQ